MVKRLFSLLLALAVALSLAAQALAADGSGDNRDEPITLVSSSLEDGAVITGDALSVRLEFNKNVVNFSVRENNMGRFALYHESGRKHPLTVTMGDDQVDPGAKRLVEVSATGLEPGGYALVIMSGLMAKNGVSLTEDIELHFRVEGAAAEEAAEPDQPAEPEQSAEPAEPETPAALEEPAEQEHAEPAEPEEAAEPGEPAEPQEPADPEGAAGRDVVSEAEQPAAQEEAAEADAEQRGFEGVVAVVICLAGVLVIAGLLGRRRVRAS